MPSIEHKFIQLGNTRLGTYNLWDCYNTAGLVKPLVQEAKDAGQWEYYLRVVKPMQHAVIDMQRMGIKVDMMARKRLKLKLRKELREGDAYIRQVATDKGFQFTDKFPNSKLQVAKFLFGTLDLRGSTKKTAGGRGSVDQDALTRILRNMRVRDRGYIPLIHALFHRSRIFTVLTRYLDFDVDPDGCVRPTVKMASVKTHRLAYEDPALQQFPEECRHIFTGDILAGDKSQLEARLLAYYSDDPIDIDIFESGKDIHSLTAREVFDKTQEEWDDTDPTTRAKERGFAKAFRYRMVYGGSMGSGDKKLYCPCPKCIEHNPPVVDLKPKEMVAKELKWMANHPWFERWRNQVADFVKKKHYYELPLGGRRYITKAWGSDLARELSNIPMQQGGAQIMNTIQVQLHREKVPVFLQWHDAFYARGYQDHQHFKEVMEQPVTINGHKIVIPIDMARGQNMGKYHAEKNPQGLKEL
jgi:DNA polymerase-1